MKVSDKRIWLTAAGVIIALLAVTRAADNIGSEHTENALLRALATFGIARALNGVISVAQGTEVALEPAGVGVTFTPGQILDPVNDLVERFSWVMLVSSASLGTLNVLLAMSVWKWFNLLFIVFLTTSLILIWFGNLKREWYYRMIMRITLVLLLLRFVSPVIAISNEFVYQYFLEPRYMVAVASLEETTGTIQDINEELQDEKQEQVESSLLDKAKELYKSATSSISRTLDVEGQLQRYEQAANEAARHAIDLIVIFVFQTILLPIAFLWLTWTSIRYIIFGYPLSAENKGD